MNKTKNVLDLGKVPSHPYDIHKIKLPDGIPRSPLLAMLCGKRGQGKTTTAVRLLHFYLNHNPQVFHNDLVFVLSPTAESQQHLWDYLQIPEDNVHVVHNNKQCQERVEEILEILKEKKKKYDEDQEYLEAYDALCQNKTLTTRQINILDQRDCQPLEDPEPWPRPCLLLDDLSHMKFLDSKPFISLCLRHRHIAGGVGLSIMMLVQSLRGGISRVIRQNCSLIILYSTHDQTAKDDLYAECSHLLEKDEFLALFAHATEEKHSFLSVDLSADDINKAFSKDFSHYYQVKGLDQAGWADQPLLISHEQVPAKPHK